MGYIGPGNVAGEEDVCFAHAYRTTVKCVSKTAELIFIKREDFERLKNYPSTWDHIVGLNAEKVVRYFDAIKNNCKN